MAKILVLLGRSYASAVEGLGDIVTDPKDFFNDPMDYGLVLFTGGEDITPEWYGHTSPKSMCYNSEERDIYERKVFHHAIKHGVRMAGICRGTQFINVMAGGKMFHHVDNHSGGRHIMELPNSDVIEVNSLHHQMVIPPEDGLVVGWSPEALSPKYFGDKDVEVMGPEVEPESIILPSIQSAGVQYHPEMMSSNSDGRRYFYDMAEALIKTDKFSTFIAKFTGSSCDSFPNLRGRPWHSKQLTRSAH